MSNNSQGQPMKMDILREENNTPIGRLEVAFSCLHSGEGTPSRQSLLEALASKLKAEQDNIVLVKAVTRTGTHRTKGIAHVYQSKEVMSTVEPSHILERATKKKPEEKVEEKAPEKQKPEEKAPKTEKPEKGSEE